jgi:hypothetical protein
MVRIVGVKSLPLMSDFIESIRCDVWGDGFIASIRTDSGFDVFKRSLQHSSELLERCNQVKWA